MDVLDILDSLIILVILACSISPSCTIVGADNLVEVVHNLEREFGCEEGDSGPIIEQVPCFVGQGFKFGNESINSPWGEGEMTESFLCMLRGASVLEACFEGSNDGVPVKFIIGIKPHVVLVKGPHSPVLNPVLDIFSLNKPQKCHVLDSSFFLSSYLPFHHSPISPSISYRFPLRHKPLSLSSYLHVHYSLLGPIS